MDQLCSISMISLYLMWFLRLNLSLIKTHSVLVWVIGHSCSSKQQTFGLKSINYKIITVNQPVTKSKGSTYQVLKNVFVTSKEKSYYFLREQMVQYLPGKLTRSFQMSFKKHKCRLFKRWKRKERKMTWDYRRRKTWSIKVTHVRIHHGFCLIPHLALLTCPISSR